MNIMKVGKRICVIGSVIVAAACGRSGWTVEEKRLIDGQDEVMRVLTINDLKDSLTLRETCSEIDVRDLRSEEFSDLARKMVATVTSPEQDGVGIAGPQVGILRRVVAVQRFDKEDEPFEVYPNIRITERRGEKQTGPEGCLSIPGRRGDVARYQDIDISYTSIKTLKDTTETIKGFTAVIFQHECDHLDGVLYIDYIDGKVSDR